MASIKPYISQYLILSLIFLLSCGDDSIEDPKNGDLNYGFKSNQKKIGRKI